MRIGLVSAYDFAYPGGVTSHISQLHGHYVSMGHHVRIIAPSSLAAEALENPDVIVCGRPVAVPASGSIARITISLRLSKQVKEVLDGERFDVVHLHEPLMPTLPLTVLRFSQAVNVGTFHAHRDYSLAYLYARRLLKPSFRRLDGKVAVSRPAEDFVSQYFPGYYNIIPNGIDLDHFNPEVEPLPRFQDGKLNILFVGRFEPRKGLRYLVRAYARVKTEFPEARLIIVGPDGGLRDDYAKLIAKARLPDVVFAGYVPYGELPRYYRSAHVFCSPATGQESQGIVLLEAMACGTPVVVSNIEGFASVVTHGEEGLLTPPKDEARLAVALEKVLADRDLRAGLSDRALLTAQQYGWKRVSQRLISYYERLMEAKGGGHQGGPLPAMPRRRWGGLLPPHPVLRAPLGRVRR